MQPTSQFQGEFRYDIVQQQSSQSIPSSRPFLNQGFQSPIHNTMPYPLANRQERREKSTSMSSKSCSNHESTYNQGLSSLGDDART